MRLKLLLGAMLLAGTVQVQAQTTPAPQDNPDAPERTADNEDRIVCKRFQKIGSLVASYKTCKTVREWRRERDNIRTNRGGGACGGTAETGMCGGS
ncbi:MULTISPECIES: hypothetical protein [Sphingomonas]|nr:MULTISPECIES: hypothetical protein [Sphingomonas]